MKSDISTLLCDARAAVEKLQKLVPPDANIKSIEVSTDVLWEATEDVLGQLKEVSQSLDHIRDSIGFN